MADTKSTGTLIYQWTADKETYRLIAVGRYSAGYEDSYLIERRDLDGIGGVRWVSYARWAADDDDTQAVLIGAIKTLAAELQRQRIPK